VIDFTHLSLYTVLSSNKNFAVFNQTAAFVLFCHIYYFTTDWKRSTFIQPNEI